MSVNKRNGSPYWYYSHTINGQRMERSTQTTRKTLARQIASTAKADFLRNQNETRL